MFKIYLKIAVRNMLKNRFYSLINILGLALGLATCMLVFMYIKGELGYDRFHPDFERIYRVNTDFKIGGKSTIIPFSTTRLAPALQEGFPEVESAVRLEREERKIVAVEREGVLEAFAEDHLMFADSNFFRFFNFPLKEGNANTALKDPSSVVLTEGTARKYFGKAVNFQELLGKSVLLGEDKKPFTITAIAEEVPERSHIQFDLVVPTLSIFRFEEGSWGSNNFRTYVKISEAASEREDVVPELEKKIASLAMKHLGPEFQRLMNRPFDDFMAGGNHWKSFLYPIKDIHLKSRLADEMERGGNILYLYLFAAVSVFIMVLACVNFMNLATARSANRAKEIGVRKALGSYRSQLARQFLLESLLYSLMALVVAFIFADLALPLFNELTGKELESLYTDPVLLGFGLLTSFVVGIASGFYPAFYLTRFETAEVLKGKTGSGYKQSRLRNFLVVFQFGVAILLIICTLMVQQQLNFLRNKPLGFEKDNVLVINNTLMLGKNAATFKEQVKEVSGVINASFSDYVPGDVFMNSTAFRVRGESPESSIAVIQADADFLETMGVKLVAGRFLGEKRASDSSAIVINEAAASYLEGEKILEQEIDVFVRPEQEHKVLGIISDFNFKSLQEEIRPFGIILNQGDYRMLSVRFKGSPAQQLNEIKTIWEEVAPGVPFEYSFLDQRLDALYSAEQQMGRIMAVFTAMAIFIACLGLLGLAAFTAEQRRKEIGIRKVLGSSVWQVVLLLTKDFTRLVLFSFLFATPLAYFVMTHWLNNFAYRIPVSVGVFLLSGFFALSIALLTVSYQSLKAALENPAESLKSE